MAAILSRPQCVNGVGLKCLSSILQVIWITCILISIGVTKYKEYKYVTV